MAQNKNKEVELRMYKDLDVLRNPTIKDSVYFVYSSATQEVTQIWVTTNQNIPRPVALGTVTNITSPDGSIDITTLPTETQIQIQASILATINSALQPGDNVSELVNDGDGVNPYLTQDAFETLLGSLLREEFEYTGSQTFTTANDYAQVYSVEVTGVGALHSSQYTLTPPNQITINDALEIGDFVVVLYTQDNVSSLTYYTQAQTDNLLLTKEDVANKQDSLTLDGTGLKYPTVDAVNNALTSLVVSDATTTSKGVVQLAGDLSGTASLPTVPALATKQATLVSGTNIKTLEGQSLLGSGNIDLTKTDVGLSNVDNTSDLAKPVSTATQTALNLKEDASNKKDVIVGNETSSIFYASIKGIVDWLTSTKIKSILGVTTLSGSNTGDETTATLKTKIDEELAYACSDEISALVVGTVITFRMPFAMTLSSMRASVNTAPTVTSLIVDVKETGVSIFSTLLSIDATEKTSTTAAIPAVISDINLADDSEITVSITQIGSGVAGAGLKILFIGKRT